MHQIVLVKPVVRLVQEELAAFQQRGRVFFAYEAFTQPTCTVLIGQFFRICRPLLAQGGNDGQRQNTQGRHALLAVNNLEISVRRGFHHQCTHVVAPLGLLHQVIDIVPEVFPVFLLP